MAPVAVVDGEGDVEMTATAEPALQNFFHAEILSALFLDIEHFRVAHVATHPVEMRFVREVCRGDAPHLGCQLYCPVKIHDRGFLIQVSAWGYQPSPERLGPVDTISVFGGREWFFPEVDVLFFDVGAVFSVALDTVSLMTECGRAVMAGSAIAAFI